MQQYSSIQNQQKQKTKKSKITFCKKKIYDYPYIKHNHVCIVMRNFCWIMYYDNVHKSSKIFSFLCCILSNMFVCIHAVGDFVVVFILFAFLFAKCQILFRYYFLCFIFALHDTLVICRNFCIMIVSILFSNDKSILHFFDVFFCTSYFMLRGFMDYLCVFSKHIQCVFCYCLSLFSFSVFIIKLIFVFIFSFHFFKLYSSKLD